MNAKWTLAIATFCLSSPSLLAQPTAAIVTLSSGGGFAAAAEQTFLVVGQPFVGQVGGPSVGASFGFVPCLDFCPGDFDNDGFVTGIDFDLYVHAFETGNQSADFDRDGFITGIDFDLFVQEFEAGC